MIRNNDIWLISEDVKGNIFVVDILNLYIIDVKIYIFELLDECIDFLDDIEVIRNELIRIWIGIYGYGVFIYDKNRC